MNISMMNFLARKIVKDDESAREFDDVDPDCPMSENDQELDGDFLNPEPKSLMSCLSDYDPDKSDDRSISSIVNQEYGYDCNYDYDSGKKTK